MHRGVLLHVVLCFSDVASILMTILLTNNVVGEELFLSYGDGFWSIQKDSIRAVNREKQREVELEQVSEQLL